MFVLYINILCIVKKQTHDQIQNHWNKISYKKEAIEIYDKDRNM